MGTAPGSARARVLQQESSGTGYYDWQISTIAVRDHQISLHMKPGVLGFGGLDPAAALLAEAIQVAPGDRVLDLHCGAGLVGSLAAILSGSGQVTLADSHVVSVACAGRTIDSTGLSNATVYASQGTQAIRPLPMVDVAALRLPKGRQLARKLAWDAFHALDIGGRFYLAGGNREGIKPALSMVQDLFGKVVVSAYRKGFRVGVAQKNASVPAEPAAFTDPWLESSWVHEFTVQLRGKPYHICSRPGIFSWDRLDPGTQILIEEFEISPESNVLDLGCGHGIIGAVAADLATSGRAVLVDADVVAVDAAGQTLARNGITNSEVFLSDCGDAVAGSQFDVVVTNPPFHQGKVTSRAAADQFITVAADLLAPGGTFYLVANRFLPYEKQLEGLFGGVQLVHADGRYKVLSARR